MTETLEGGCLCGSIRYRCDAEPQLVAHCFCTDCQRAGGAQMSTNAIVPQTAVTLLQGEPREYTTQADRGGTVRRLFCGDCGSPLVSEASAMPGMSILKVGTLDAPSRLQPTMCLFTDSAPAWAIIPEGMALFGGMPPA